MKQLLFLLLLVSGTCSGLTEAEVIRSVLTHYPLIDQSVLKARAAEGELQAAKGAFDHRLNFKSRAYRQRPYTNEYFETSLERQTPWGGAKLIAGHRQGAGKFNFYDLKKETSTAGQIFAGITLPLLRNLQTDGYRTDLEINRLKNEQAKLEVRVKKLVYVHKALSLYYRWVLQLKKLEISRYLLELAETRDEMLIRRFKSGDVEKLKVIDNQRAINKRRSEFISSEIELRRESAELSLYVRDEQGVPKVPTPVSNPEEVLKNLATAGRKKVGQENPQLQVINFEKEKLQLKNELQDQGKLPGLSVNVLGAQELSERQDYGEHVLEVGLKFDFPLENRQARGKSVAALYEMKAIEKAQIYLRQELTQQYDFSVSASSSSKEKWEVIDKEYDNTLKVSEGERKKWASGASDLFVVNLREQDLADVDIKRWSALYEYHQYNLDASLYSASLPIDL